MGETNRLNTSGSDESWLSVAIMNNLLSNLINLIFTFVVGLLARYAFPWEEKGGD
jgi:hypothetical protein